MNIDLPIRDHNAVHHGAQELLPGLGREGRECAPNLPAEGLKAGVELGLLARGHLLAAQHPETPLDVGSPLPQESLSPAELLEFNEPCLVGIEQALRLAVQLRELFLEPLHLGRKDALRPCRRLGTEAAVLWSAKTIVRALLLLKRRRR